MKSTTWTTTEHIVIDEIMRFDGEASNEKLREAETNTPHMLSDVTPVVLGYEDGELIAWVRSKDDSIMVAHKGDALVRHGEDLWVFPAKMVEKLLKRYRQ